MEVSAKILETELRNYETQKQELEADYNALLKERTSFNEEKDLFYIQSDALDTREEQLDQELEQIKDLAKEKARLAKLEKQLQKKYKKLLREAHDAEKNKTDVRAEMYENMKKESDLKLREKLVEDAGKDVKEQKMSLDQQQSAIELMREELQLKLDEYEVRKNELNSKMEQIQADKKTLSQREILIEQQVLTKSNRLVAVEKRVGEIEKDGKYEEELKAKTQEVDELQEEIDGLKLSLIHEKEELLGRENKLIEEMAANEKTKQKLSNDLENYNKLKSQLENRLKVILTERKIFMNQIDYFTGLQKKKVDELNEIEKQKFAEFDRIQADLDHRAQEVSTALEIVNKAKGQIKGGKKLLEIGVDELSDDQSLSEVKHKPINTLSSMQSGEMANLVDVNQAMTSKTELSSFPEVPQNFWDLFSGVSAGMSIYARNKDINDAKQRELEFMLGRLDLKIESIDGQVRVRSQRMITTEIDIRNVQKDIKTTFSGPGIKALEKNVEQSKEKLASEKLAVIDLEMSKIADRLACLARELDLLESMKNNEKIRDTFIDDWGQFVQEVSDVDDRVRDHISYESMAYMYAQLTENVEAENATIVDRMHSVEEKIATLKAEKAKFADQKAQILKGQVQAEEQLKVKEAKLGEFKQFLDVKLENFMAEKKELETEKIEIKRTKSELLTEKESLNSVKADLDTKLTRYLSDKKELKHRQNGVDAMKRANEIKKAELEREIQLTSQESEVEKTRLRRFSQALDEEKKTIEQKQELVSSQVVQNQELGSELEEKLVTYEKSKMALLTGLDTLFYEKEEFHNSRVEFENASREFELKREDSRRKTLEESTMRQAEFDAERAELQDLKMQLDEEKAKNLAAVAAKQKNLTERESSIKLLKKQVEEKEKNVKQREQELQTMSQNLEKTKKGLDINLKRYQKDNMDLKAKLVKLDAQRKEIAEFKANIESVSSTVRQSIAQNKKNLSKLQKQKTEATDSAELQTISKEITVCIQRIKDQEAEVEAKDAKLRNLETKLSKDQMTIDEDKASLEIARQKVENEALNYDKLKVQLDLDSKHLLEEEERFTEQKRLFALESQQLKVKHAEIIETLNYQHQEELHARQLSIETQYRELETVRKELIARETEISNRDMDLQTTLTEHRERLARIMSREVNTEIREHEVIERETRLLVRTQGMEDLRAALRAAIEKIQSLNAEMEEMQIKNDMLEKRVEEEDAENEELVEKFNKMTVTKDKVINDLHKKVAELTEEWNEVSDKMHDEKDEKEAQIFKNKELEDKIKKLETQLKSNVVSSNPLLAGKTAQPDKSGAKQVGQLQDEVKKLKTTISNLTEENKKLKTDVNNASKGAKAQNNSQVDTLKTKIETLTKENKKVNERLKEELNRVDTLSKQLKKAESGAAGGLLSLMTKGTPKGTGLLSTPKGGLLSTPKG